MVKVDFVKRIGNPETPCVDGCLVSY